MIFKTIIRIPYFMIYSTFEWGSTVSVLLLRLKQKYYKLVFGFIVELSCELKHIHVFNIVRPELIVEAIQMVN